MRNCQDVSQTATERKSMHMKVQLHRSLCHLLLGMVDYLSAGGQERSSVNISDKHASRVSTLLSGLENPRQP